MVASAPFIQTRDDLILATKRVKELSRMNNNEELTEALKAEFKLIILQIDAYERQHNLKLPLPDPIEAILFEMEMRDLKRADMVSYFGDASATSQVLNRKRRLTLDMIRRLHEGLGIPLSSLFSEYPLEA
jgi:HTH-type transcriptional regulator / antitoxin HigA